MLLSTLMTTSDTEIRQVKVRYRRPDNGVWATIPLRFEVPVAGNALLAKAIIVISWVFLALACWRIIFNDNWGQANPTMKALSAFVALACVALNAYGSRKVYKSRLADKWNVPQSGWEVDDQLWCRALEKVHKLVITEGRSGEASVTAGTMVVRSLMGEASAAEACAIEEYAGHISHMLSQTKQLERYADQQLTPGDSANLVDRSKIRRLH